MNIAPGCDFESRCPDRMDICRTRFSRRDHGIGRSHSMLFQVWRLSILQSSPKSEPLLRIEGLTKSYSQGHWWEKRFQTKALDGVDLTLEREKRLPWWENQVREDHAGNVRGHAGQA